MLNPIKIMAMKTKNHFSVGDIVYKVDPVNLIISKFSIINVDSNAGQIVILKQEKTISSIQKQILISIFEFAKENKRRLFFQTEDDANNFVRIQVSM